MRKTYLLFALLFLLNHLWAQQEASLAFLSHLVQAPTQANPAIFTTHKINVSLPGFYGDFRNSAFSMGELFTHASDGRLLDPDPVLDKLAPTGNTFRATAAVNGFAASFQVKKKFQLSVFQNTRFDLQFRYPKALPVLLWKGNAAFIGQEIHLAPKLNLLGYSEYGFGIAAQLDKLFSVGANIKYLTGIAAVKTVHSEASIFTSDEYYQLTLTSDILLRTGGLTDIFDENENAILVNNDPAAFFNSNNRGFAVDLGIRFTPSESAEFQVAMKDIGQVSWQENALEQRSRGTYQYDGVNINLYDDENDDFDLDEIRDSLDALLNFTAMENNFITSLPARIMLSGQYRIQPTLSAGVLVNSEFYGNATSTLFAVNVQKQFGRWLYTGVTAGYHTLSSSFLGLNAAVSLGPVQVFAITDNLLTLLDVEKGRGTNLRAGVNLTFGRK